MVNIAVGKIGKSILFNSENWGAIGGDNEAPIFYETLFHKNPDINFYLVGVSDYRRIDHKIRDRINKHGNVIDAWEGFSEWRKTWSGDDEHSEYIDYMDHWMKTAPKMDAGLYFMGPVGTSNVFGKARKMAPPHELASPLMMLCKYAGSFINFINETLLPYAIILNDPRFFYTTPRDLIHPPKVILSQFTETITHCPKKSYTNPELNTFNIPAKYKAIETIFLIGKERGKAIAEIPSTLESFFSEEVNTAKDEKDIKFMIICNEGRPSRYSDLKRYILDNVKDVDIYGKWEEKTIGDDKRFKGPKKFNELQEMLPRVKYTFCIPIKKGWATSKFWEMAHYGIIPFLHPNYDDQNNLKCPEFIRIKDSQDLFKKIEFLETHPEAYDILRKNLDKMLLDEYYDGSYMNNLALKTIEEIVNEQ